MKKLLSLSFLLLPLAGSLQAAEIVSETRKIDAGVQKVTIDGVIDVKIKQGGSPSLVVFGEKTQLPKITVVQRGDTIVIDTEHENSNGNNENGNKMRAEITLPNLNGLISNGVGRSDVQGFSGETVDIDLKGAGAISLQGNYRQVHSRLSGVGNMNLNLGNNDTTYFKLSGAGSAVVRGQGKNFDVELTGLGGLDAQKFEVDALKLKLKGMGSASAYARQAAAVTLSGMGSVTVYGNPATRSGAKDGLGSINWK